MLANPFGKREAVHVRHLDVRENNVDVDLGLLEYDHRLVSADGLDDLEAALAEIARDHHAHQHIVIDDQDALQAILNRLNCVGHWYSSSRWWRCLPADA